ncbi:MAG: sugar phosphorylase [Chloroflexi bacterium]|nr:sugar phosphorylase [Chloroflexota bacterium]
MNIDRVRSLLMQIYGEGISADVLRQATRIIDDYRGRLPAPRNMGLTQRDAILIVYPDQVQDGERSSLQVLGEFCEKHFFDSISVIHILPFYPWSSDDGFSVIDFRAVSPEYGSWDDVQGLGRHFRLMFDAVINHASIQSTWFQGMLRGDPRTRNYFISPTDDADLTKVVRPRALPLLTTFQTDSGEKKVWTTFSADQVDLNYENPSVLLEILDILLFYVSQGADFIRLDAIAYLWKKPGTSCIHLPQTHAVIQLFRAVLDEIAPHVMLITETNVPHADNISYFGDGTNEAQMVYNFSLPPLVLHAFQTGSAETLSRWAGMLQLPSEQVTFFNFLASHDGIGLNPLRDILSAAEIEEVVNRVLAHGGLVSFKSESDGTKRPYELNINYFDALNDPKADDPLNAQVDRFITAHAILLSMVGVPGIYFHSFAGLCGWPEGVLQTGHNRTINRRKLDKNEIETLLSNPASREAQVFNRLRHLLKVRGLHDAFHPHGNQEIVNSSSGVFGLLRSSPDGKDRVLCLHNVSDRVQILDPKNISAFEKLSAQPADIISEREIQPDQPLVIQPFQTLWIG